MLKTVVLSDEQRDELHRKASKGDKGAKSRLLETYIGFAASVAKKYKYYGITFDDLFQEACVGMAVAIPKFDPDKGIKFTTYAVHHMRQHILEFVLGNYRMVNPMTTKSRKKLFFNYRKLKNVGMTNEEISIHLDVDLEDVTVMESFFKNIDAPLVRWNEDGTEENWIPSLVTEDTFIDEIDSERIRAAVDGALFDLPDRDRDIIESRWLADEKMTLHQMSDKYGVSAERIRQIEMEALTKIRNIVGVRDL